MLWLQTPEWGRRLAAITILVVALLIEFRPDATTEHPFLTDEASAGTEIGSWNTEMRRVPAGLFDPVRLPASATRPLHAGEPVLATAIGSGPQIPDGWWNIETDLPSTAALGARVRVLVGDTGRWVEGFVSAAESEDDFGGEPGMVAVSPEDAFEVAGAAAAGSLFVMIETG